MTPVQPSVASSATASQRSPPACSASGERAFTITGIGDHDRPEWPFTINGMRTIGAQRAKLQRKTAPMIGPAALGDLNKVVSGQRPVPREFVLAGIGRQHAVAPGPRQVVIRRHSGVSAPGRPRDSPERVAYKPRSCRATHDRANQRVPVACQDCRAGSRAQKCGAYVAHYIGATM